MDDPYRGQVHPPDDSVDELYDESLLEMQTKPDIDIDEFLSQAPAKSHKKLKTIRQKMTQRNANTLDEDEIADMKVSGVIKRVSLKNFMCHANFELDFGPRLNFIIGHNGSGKSSILTAISICLGAKATETNRGSSLRDLIKEGTTVSEVTVVLANDGEEAFDRGTYGKEIIIQRTLRHDATSFPYKIKSENGKTISTKKSDLDAILDYFNIAVSNPMCFLSQDMARSFLTASSDDQKFKFFMRGTLMEATLENLKKTREVKSQVELRITKLKDGLLDLKEEATEARKLHDRLVDSNDLRHRQRALHGKYFWMENAHATNLIEQIYTTQEEHQEVVSELTHQINTLEDELEQIGEERSHLEKKKQALTEEMNIIKQEHTERKTELKAVERRISKANNQLQEFSSETNACQKKIDALDRKIQKEIEELRRKNGGSKDVLEQQLESLKERKRPLNEQAEQISAQLDDIGDRYREEFDNVSAQKSDLDAQVRYNEDIIKDAELQRRSTPNPLNAYPSEIASVVRDINNSRAFSDKVIGPVGRHVFLKPGFEKYQQIIESNIGSHLNTFVVQNYRDQRALQGVLRQNRAKASILIRKNERFNFSDGRPQREIPTILDALEFDNEDVMFILIDTAHIESIALTDQRKHGQAMLERRTRNVNSVLSLNDRSSGFHMSINRNNAFLSNPVFYDLNSRAKIVPKGGITDTSAQRRALSDLKEQINQLAGQNANLHDQQKQEKQGLTHELARLKGENRRLGAEIFQIEKKLQEDSDTGKLEAYNEDKYETQRQLDAYAASIPPVKEEFDTLATYYKELEADLKEIRQRAKGQADITDAAGEKLISCEAEIQVRIRKKEYFVNSKKKRVDELAETIASLPSWERKQASTEESAMKMCTREEADSIQISSMDHLKAEISKVSSKVQEADQLLGKSPEEIVNEDIIARKKYHGAVTQFTEAKQAVELLSSSLDQRLKAFRTSRDTTFVEAHLDFSDSLQFRNFSGSLNFDTQKNKLEMLVSTKNDKKPRHVDSLSGGEKSFSQIALLLATWKPMRSRIKGLDEFDVFMDQVNRKIGMRLMLSKLSREAKAQTIFITPQDIGQIAELDPNFVQIHRIKDPRATQP